MSSQSLVNFARLFISTVKLRFQELKVPNGVQQAMFACQRQLNPGMQRRIVKQICKCLEQENSKMRQEVEW